LGGIFLVGFFLGRIIAGATVFVVSIAGLVALADLVAFAASAASTAFIAPVGFFAFDDLGESGRTGTG
jgi:hypothetical protein